MKLLHTMLILSVYFPAQSFGQILFSNGATVSVTTGGLLHVNGGIELSGSSGLTNAGQITTTKLSTFLDPGTLTIGTTSTVSGNGAYNVEQDWINDGVFNFGSSTVTLFGNTQQLITSNNSVSTTFNNLILTGTGTGNNRKKTLQNVNALTSAAGTLTLNNRELETQTNRFTVLNPSTAAVTFDPTPGAEGFVSSLSQGYLSRITNTAASYIFPTGSSTGTLRFRPVELSPQTNVSSEYVVRMNNFDSNTQNFDRSETDGSECSLNANYFHSIERLSGNAATDIKLYYIPASDGTWNGIAHWRDASTDWNDIVAATTGTSGIFTTRTKTGWNFTNPGHPYILSNLRPEAPVLNCPTLCENSEGNLFTLTGTTPTYQWTFPSNGTIISGQGTANVTADWTIGSGQVSAIAVDANGCTSLPGTCSPTISPNPTVQFTYTEDGNTFNFTDQTSGANSWDWSFGDGGNASSQNPSHTYSDISAYTVTLEVTNAIGCVGTGSQLIEIFQEIVVPNVITPNGDGTNDQFEINTSGLKEYELIIVNRWGNVVFNTTTPNVHWDGRINGNDVVDGVYFYTLNAATTTKEYSFQGNVTVIKN